MILARRMTPALTQLDTQGGAGRRFRFRRLGDSFAAERHRTYRDPVGITAKWHASDRVVGLHSDAQPA
jgi:hypothetical protein